MANPQTHILRATMVRQFQAC